MKKVKIYTLVDGNERIIIIEKGMMLREEVYRLGVRESDILHIQLVIQEEE
ncbi:hypothetical protein AB3N02_31815 [Priestia aryabhattai]|uniref:hypothetical protein n=1 Tax=Priestia aryabhattai TaxID=412384 RepID=UPI0039A3F715